MADAFSRVAVKTIADGDVAVKLSDGTDTAAVSAAGELSVQVTQPIPAGTNVIGEVKVTDGTDDLAINSSGAAAADITHIGGSAPANTNPLPVRLSNGTSFVSDSNPVPVSIVDDVAGTILADEQTSSDIAGNGGTGTVSFDLVTNTKVASLAELVFASSVQMKGNLEAFNGTTAAEVGNFILPQGGGTIALDLRRIGQASAFQLTGDGAAVRFRLQLTNLDKNDQAAAYATLAWSEA